MAKRKTTSEERKKFIEEQRAAEASYKGPGRRLPVDMSFIDRKGNIVWPNKGEYEKSYAKKILSSYNEATALNEQYDGLVSEYGKNSREVYEFEKNELGIRKRRKPSKLEGELAIIGIAGAIFFLSSNITGNVIGNLTNSTSNIIGAGLLVVGLIAGYFWLKK